MTVLSDVITLAIPGVKQISQGDIRIAFQDVKEVPNVHKNTDKNR